MDKWHRHGWKGASGPIGHADLWSKVHFLVKAHGDTLSFQWVPSHTEFPGNEEADKLAEQGREKHPDNMVYRGKRLCAQALRDVGLEILSSGSSEGRSSVDSGGSRVEVERGLRAVGLELLSSGGSGVGGSSLDSGGGSSLEGEEEWDWSSKSTLREQGSEATTDSEGFSSLDSGESWYSTAVSTQERRVVKRRRVRGRSSGNSSG